MSEPIKDPNEAINVLEKSVGRDISMMIDEINRAELTLAKEVLLVSSAILAVIGAIGRSQTKLYGIDLFLISVAVPLLASSIIAGVVHLLLTLFFWQSGHDTLTQLKEDMDIDPDPIRSAVLMRQVYNRINKASSNRIFLWIQTTTFLLSIVFLSILIILGLH